jgi:Tfp pilus assembly protein PilN
MIKINLLESVTDRPTGAAMVEDKVANPRMQTLLLVMTVFGLLVLGMGYDFISSRSAYDTAQRELQNQQRINQLMLTVNKEQAELEKKTQDIQTRIDAITKLRDSQQGPSAVLREIKMRFDSVPGLYLKSIEQKESEITIKGESPNENSVTKFGQSLEFSGGLFTNLNIETQREIAQAPKVSMGSIAGATTVASEVVTFTVKCNYGQSKTQSQPQPANNNPANQVAMKK